jgi:hypothetical protein
MKEKFIEFLEENRALENYRENIKVSWKKDTVEQMIRLFEKHNIPEALWLSCSFEFAENADYWLKLNRKWQAYVKLYYSNVN